MKSLKTYSILSFFLLLCSISVQGATEINGIYYTFTDNSATVDKNPSLYTGSVTIPSSVTYNGTSYTVTAIAHYAFMGCSEVTEIIIPETVTDIGWDSFNGCSSISSITLPSKITYIASRTFKDCTNLTAITIPNTVLVIQNQAFENCTNLKQIIVPDGVQNINERAFANCAKMESAYISKTVNSIYNRIFEGCSSLTSIIVDPENYRYDSHNNCNAVIYKPSKTLIAGCKTTTIPTDITTIANGAFYKNQGITSVNIPDNITTIYSEAFAGCNELREVYIGSGASNIAYNAFQSCAKLRKITINAGNTTYDSRNGCNAVIQISTNQLVLGCGNTTIPNGVTSIGNYAFANCPSLSSVSIPASVTEICEYAFRSCSALKSLNIGSGVSNIGNMAFNNCTALENISVSANNTYFDSRNNCNAIINSSTNELMLGCCNTIIPDGIVAIGDRAFDRCNKLLNINFPSSVTSIGAYAFYYCGGLTSLTIPNQITSIGSNAFSGCSNLVIARLGTGLNTVGTYAFYDCKKLTDIYSYATTPPVIQSEKDYGAFNTAASITLHVPEEALESYKAGDYWKNFGAIVPIDSETDGIQSLHIQPSANKIFDINGRLILQNVSNVREAVNQLPKGLYISDGVKILKK